MIAICYKGIAYPILWQLLPKAGNSNTAERKALMERFLRLVPASKIKAFLADREFISKEWFRFLSDRDVPFCIRVKKDTTVEAGSGPGDRPGGSSRTCWSWEAPMVGQKLMGRCVF